MIYKEDFNMIKAQVLLIPQFTDVMNLRLYTKVADNFKLINIGNGIIQPQFLKKDPKFGGIAVLNESILKNDIEIPFRFYSGSIGKFFINDYINDYIEICGYFKHRFHANKEFQKNGIRLVIDILKRQNCYDQTVERKLKRVDFNGK